VEETEVELGCYWLENAGVETLGTERAGDFLTSRPIFAQELATYCHGNFLEFTEC